LKRKTNLIKGQKTIKRMRIKIKIKKYKYFFLLKGGIEKKNQFNKRTKKNNQKNEDQIEKKNI